VNINMPITSKVHLIRQVLSTICKGPGFDTVLSKVLNSVRFIDERKCVPLPFGFVATHHTRTLENWC